jgi:glutamate dehydrogenase
MEKQSDIGDRANESVRIDASQLQARVVGEGANLGFTQHGRIEYALGGGHINTDAVDNSGGVDLSDHEVNLKIFFNSLRAQGIIATKEQQNDWLAKVTDEVCQKVLANNYCQSLCLSLDQERSRQDSEPFMALADQLENTGLLDRFTDAFPQRREVLARSDKSLTRPELAVLMAYSKTLLYHLLLEQPDFLSSPYLQEFIASYFPAAIRKQFYNQVHTHPLSKEITATVLSNRIINQAGCTFLTWLEELNSTTINAAVASYLAFDKVLAGEAIRTQVYHLDNLAPVSRQYTLLLQLEDALAHFCQWTLHQEQPPVLDAATLSSLNDYLAQYIQYQEENLSEAEKEAVTEIIAELQQEDFSPELSRQLAFFKRLHDFPALVDLTTISEENFTVVARTYKAVADYLGYPSIQELLNDIPTRNHWERRAKISLEKNFKSHLGRLTLEMLSTSEHEMAAFFTTLKQQRLLNYQRIHRELRETSPTDLLPFTVLLGELEALTST